MITDKDFSDQIHILIHSLRLIPNYKSSEAEKKIGKLVREKYSDTCSECKAITEQIKNTPAKEGFLTKLGKAIEW